jgi:ubiquinone biosynthesis protein COQ4
MTLSWFRTLADAVRAIRDNPGDTQQAFRIASLASLGANRRVARRYAESPAGRRSLAQRRRLLDVLCDREKLRSYPAGSLARGYLEFVELNHITAEELAAASEDGNLHGNTPDEQFVMEQLRDMHDLWHVVTGYSTELCGEATILAFSLAQLRHPGVAILTGLALLFAASQRQTRTVLQGFRAGLAAEWLPAQDWEALLASPLDDVRRRLRLPPRS